MSAADNKRRIEAYFAKLKGKINDDLPDIIGETAVKVFKENILKGSFDGVPWKPLSPEYLEHKKRNKEKILYLNGLLFASIKYTTQPGKVIVRAGSTKVPYARIHNEGLTVNTTANVKAFTRNQYRLSKRGKRSISGSVEVRAHTRKIHYTMPQRRFLGHSVELNKALRTRIIGFLKGAKY
jgi:phage gpG-like protein